MRLRDGTVSVVADPSGRVVAMSPDAQEAFGWTHDAVDGRDLWRALRTRDEAGRAVDGPAGMADLRDAGVRRYSIRDGRDRRRWVEVRSGSPGDDQDRPLGVFFREVVAAPSVADDAATFSGTPSDAVPHALITTDPDNTVRTWNTTAALLFGREASEVCGTPLERVAVPEDRAKLAKAFVTVVRDGVSLSVRARGRHRDGHDFDATATFAPLLDAHGGISGVIVAVQDATTLRASTQRLRQADSRFDGTFHAAAIGMALVGPDGLVQEANAALCRLLARDLSELRSLRLTELTHPDDRAESERQAGAALRGEQDSYHLTKRYVLPDGGDLWARVTVSLVRDATGAPLHLVAQVEDLSAQRTAEEEVRRHARQLEALTQRDGPEAPLPPADFRRQVDARLAIGQTPAVVLVAHAPPGARVPPGAIAMLRSVSRQEDTIGHVDAESVGILLPDSGADDGLAVRDRLTETPAGLDRCTFAVGEAGETASTLLARAAREHPRRARDRRIDADLPAGARPLVELMRRHLDVAVSFLSRHVGEEAHLVLMAGEHERLGVHEGHTMPLRHSHCRLMLEGEIDQVTQLAEHPATRDMPLTVGLGLRAYAGVPVRLPDGEHYGTLCAVDQRDRPDLGERELGLLRFAGDEIAKLVAAERHAQSIRRRQLGATGVQTLLGALEVRDHYTGEHSREVVALAGDVARRLGLDADEIHDVEQVALLHDLGKLGIPDAILHKQGPLTEQEWELMRQHPVVGERIVAGTAGLAHLAPAMRAEHERWDGGGYPDGLAGAAIPLASRITLACDALHAMTSDRPYRPALSAERAREELRAGAGTQFDPQVVQALLAHLSATEDHDTVLMAPARRGVHQADKSV